LISHFLQIDKQVITLCKNEDVWDILKTIIQAVFPMLIVLRLADQKEAVMDKLYYYVRRMDITIERSKDTLNAAERRLNNSGLHMRTQHLNDENSDDDDNSEGSLDDDLLSDDDDNESSNKNDEDGGLGLRVQRRWKHRRSNLVSDFCIAGWMLCPIAEVREDAKKHIGEDRNTMERLLKKLYAPDKEAASDEVANLLNRFWEEFEHFQNKTGPYASRPHIWHPNNADITNGHSHIWHKKNSLPYTTILGKLACRVCSKIVGMGSAERAWGDVKHLKTDKRCSLRIEALKKQSTIFGASCMEAARIDRQRKTQENTGLPYKFWDDDDFLEEFDMLTETGEEETPRRRVVKCFLEDWEAAAVFKKDPISVTRLLKKYGGLQFYDIDTKKMFYTDAKKLNWTRPYRDQSGGYSIICYNQDYDEDDPDVKNVEPFAICNGCPLHELLRKYYKKNERDGIVVMMKSDEDDDSSTTSSEYTTK
jgi:hypothetical protein